MFTSELMETSDRSYYTDWLEEMTGKPRSLWALVPLGALKNLCMELKRKQALEMKGDTRHENVDRKKSICGTVQ